MQGHCDFTSCVSSYLSTPPPLRLGVPILMYMAS